MRKIKTIHVKATDHPVTKPDGSEIHARPIEIIDDSWARDRIKSNELTLCNHPPQSEGARAQPSPAPPPPFPPFPKIYSEIIQEMIDEGADLTATGKPELPILNKRLEAAGLEKITADERNELFAATTGGKST